MKSAAPGTGRALTRSSLASLRYRRPHGSALAATTLRLASRTPARCSFASLRHRAHKRRRQRRIAPRRNHSAWAGMDAGPRGDAADVHRGARASQGAPGQTRIGVDSGFGVTFVHDSAPNPPTSPNPPGNCSGLVLGRELRDGRGKPGGSGRGKGCGKAGGRAAGSLAGVAAGRAAGRLAGVAAGRAAGRLAGGPRKAGGSGCGGPDREGSGLAE